MSVSLLQLLFSPAQAASITGVFGAEVSADGDAFAGMLKDAQVGKADPLAHLRGISMMPISPAGSASPVMAYTANAVVAEDAASGFLVSMAGARELLANLRQQLGQEHFAGDSSDRQAFRELEEELTRELEAEGAVEIAASDVIDIEPILLQLPAIAQAQEPLKRGEMISRLMRFLQSGTGAGNAPLEKTPAAAPKITHTADPMLEVIQASMFPAAPSFQKTDVADTQTQALASERTQPSQPIEAAYRYDDAPLWLREIAPLPEELPSPSASASESLPMVTLPVTKAVQNDDRVDATQDVLAAALVQKTPPLLTSELVPEPEPVEGMAYVADRSKIRPTQVQPMSDMPSLQEKLAPLPEAYGAKPEASAVVSDTGAAVQAAVSSLDSARALALAVAVAAPAPVKTNGASVTSDVPDSDVKDAVVNHGAPRPQNEAVALHAARKNAADSKVHGTPDFSESLHGELRDLQMHDDVALSQPATAALAEKPLVHGPVRVVDASLHHYRAQVIEQVHVAIVRAKDSDVDRITIQLEPVDLGRVDVVMDVRRDGTTHVLITADRRETLDMLSRDARGLERALQDAGVKADAGSMEFNLRQQQGQNAASFHSGDGNQRPFQEQAQSHVAGSAEISEGDEVLGARTVIPQTQVTYQIHRGLDVIA